MPKIRSRLIVALTLLFLVSNVNAQRSAIDTYAITNARIVTVSGQVIERGTVVIRNGLIASAGANVSAPSDARVIDGTGLTVYPGLIDSYTNLALPEASPTPSPGPGGGGGGFFALTSQRPAAGPNSTQPPGLQPEVRVEEVIRAGGTEIEASRNIGITTALTSPRSGIWMGQSALINLAGETPQQMIVRSPVAMHVSFTPLRAGTYPGSLLGVFATLRQMMLDAQRYRDSLQIYERSPRGTRRPETDRSLEALVPVIDGRMPVVMLANTEREISRALDLAAEFKLRLIIAGGREADRVTERLVKQNVPVLLSLNLPRRTTAAIPEADPEPLRVLRERVEAQQTAGKLAKAGVRFAFQSGSLTNISELMVNAGRVIENGLTVNDALRAFTIWPAEILGVQNQLGSIEAGKIANLTVTRGDLFDRNSRVAHVFIDGRPVDLRPAAGGGPARSNLSGAWSVNVNLGGQGERTITLNLQQEGERLSGSISGPLGAGEISNASMTGGEVRFTVAINLEGQTKEATFTGRLANNEIRGNVTIVGSAPGTFTATRSGQPNQEK